jgi:hypothetical protein
MTRIFGFRRRRLERRICSAEYHLSDVRKAMLHVNVITSGGGPMVQLDKGLANAIQTMELMKLDGYVSHFRL